MRSQRSRSTRQGCLPSLLGIRPRNPCDPVGYLTFFAVRSGRGSGTGDTGDTLLKQTQSPLSALPSGQEHAPASGRTRGCAPARPLAARRHPPPEPPRRPVCPRPRPARPNPTQASRAPCRPSAPASPTAPRHPCAAFCAASLPTPRNPRQSAGGSSPSPPHGPRGVARAIHPSASRT